MYFLRVLNLRRTVNPAHRRTMERRAATNVFPTPPKTSSLSKPIRVAAGQTFTPPVAYTRYDRGSVACNGQSEGDDADAVFLLEEGATLDRVVIGANQAEGVHCLGKHLLLFLSCKSFDPSSGSCTLNYVYFEVFLFLVTHSEVL